MSDDQVQPDLERLKAKLFAVVPDGKRGALVFAFDKKGTVPWMRVGVATRLTDEDSRIQWTVGAGIEARAKDRPELQLYSAITW